jgi:hypothetical protein
MSYTNQRPFIGAFFLTKEAEDQAHVEHERVLALHAAGNPQPKPVPVPAPSGIKAGFLKLIQKTFPGEEEAHQVIGRARHAREQAEALQKQLEARVEELRRPYKQLLEFREHLACAEEVTQPAEEGIINAYLQDANHNITSLGTQLLLNERMVPILKAEVEKRTIAFNTQLQSTIEWGTKNGASKEALAEIRETFTR